ncbi:2OG-Fe(II) oxygenase family protein [Candidatus Pelagibacter sp.]|jgi:hypothetical protein|nr:2OG-Fe(II) oxygenase family protein [Candidatus Pelagibacter sp.]MDC0862251.1 putative 2OG-Fe(II) oxygenase [bacterium]
MPEEKIDLQIVRKFGPSILKVKIPNNILNNLNSQIDEILANKERQKTLDYGNKLAGDVTQEFQLDEEVVTKSGWLNFLSTCVHKWIEIETGKKITKFNLISTWVVRQFENEYNPTHWHGGHISGAGFLKLPKSFGETKQKKTNGYSGGNLQLIHGSTMFMCDSVFNIKPEVGDFYFFPNYLMHAVFPFKDSKEERRSISFNAHIDENIYNVYE